jgi:hypothetical protein
VKRKRKKGKEGRGTDLSPLFRLTPLDLAKRKRRKEKGETNEEKMEGK